MKKSVLVVLISVVSIILLLTLFRATCVKFIESHELGYKFNANTGETTTIKRTGYVVYIPFIEEVHVVDLRPVQVCLNANSRVLNCKLVRFNPKGLTLFLSWHGRADYTMSSMSGGTTSQFVEILKSYAYDGSDNIEQRYPFLEIMPSNSEVKPKAIPQNTIDAKTDSLSH